MDLAAWHEALRVRVKSLYTTMRTLYEQIAQPGTFLVSATCLGGQHGYDEAGAVAPLGGAVRASPRRTNASGPTPWSKPSISRRAASCGNRRTPHRGDAARSGAVEIGYKNGLRWTVGSAGAAGDRWAAGSRRWTANSVFLITGAAGSIVSAITADLAAASGGTFYLLDLVPEPDPNNPDSHASSMTKTASSAICLPAFRRAASEPLLRWWKKSWRRWSVRTRP